MNVILILVGGMIYLVLNGFLIIIGINGMVLFMVMFGIGFVSFVFFFDMVLLFLVEIIGISVGIYILSMRVL